MRARGLWCSAQRFITAPCDLSSQPTRSQYGHSPGLSPVQRCKVKALSSLRSIVPYIRTHFQTRCDTRKRNATLHTQQETRTGCITTQRDVTLHETCTTSHACAQECNTEANVTHRRRVESRTEDNEVTRPDERGAGDRTSGEPDGE